MLTVLISGKKTKDVIHTRVRHCYKSYICMRILLGLASLHTKGKFKEFKKRLALFLVKSFYLQRNHNKNLDNHFPCSH